MGKQGGASGKSGAGNRELTDQEMQKELDKEFAEIDKKLDEFLSGPTGTSLEIEGSYLEKHSLQSIKHDYIDEYNRNVTNYKDGFEFYDPDQTIDILYKNGSLIRVAPGDYDGSKKIKTSGIDSVIVNSGWGTAFAGKNIKLENYRETVGYGNYAYKNLKQRYNDYNDIRVDFKV